MIDLTLVYRNGFEHTLTVKTPLDGWKLCKAMLETMPNPPVQAWTRNEDNRCYSVIEGGKLI
jgi:hypothetical protein